MPQEAQKGRGEETRGVTSFTQKTADGGASRGAIGGDRGEKGGQGGLGNQKVCAAQGFVLSAQCTTQERAKNNPDES